jgi:hypothetical protein
MIGNLLSLAMGVVGGQPVTLSRFTGRAENAAGYTVPTYADPVAIAGHVQPIPQRLFQALGLDWAKEYVTLYTPAGVVVVGRDESGDKITYNGATYLCESSTDWLGQAGWVAVVAVKVPA